MLLVDYEDKLVWNDKIKAKIEKILEFASGDEPPDEMESNEEPDTLTTDSESDEEPDTLTTVRVTKNLTH